MRKSILGLIACVILPVSCSQKNETGNKPEEDERVVVHRNDPIATNDTITDSYSDGASVAGSGDPRTAWFLQNLHVAMDNADEAAAAADSVYN